MEIDKDIEITVQIDLSDADIHKWIEERIADLDILYTDEAKAKMKPLKAKYWEKWMELYWFFQIPYAELEGKDPMPEQSREDAKNYFL